jgi:hypothetical protein
MVFQNTHRPDGLPNPTAGTIEKSIFLVVMVMVKGVPVLVELILGLHHGDSHTLGSQLSGWIPMGLKCIPVCDE